jgi:Uncharacterized protein conserved in bacteria
MADTFSFSSSGLDPDIFRVLRFSGTEAVSECYRFDIELLALKEFDVKSLYDTDATFSISRHDGTSTAYRGKVASIGVERMKDGDFFKCRARLVPHLWFYTLRKSSKAYVGQAISDIIDAELKENGEGASGGFVSQFDQLPQTSFPLVVKYHETPLEFISRLLQRECLYYYFLSEGGMDTLKFSSDAKLGSNEILSAKVINNLTFSSLGEQDERILFKSAHMEQGMRSETLNLYAHDGNPDSVETLHGVGRTAIEKNMLGPLRDISNIRQSQDSQPAVRYSMSTSVRGVRVGITHDGLRALSLRHDGDQSSTVLESLGLPTESTQQEFYRNQGLWMPEGDPFIPQWKLQAPRIANAALTGFTTRINDNGTYDVKCHSIDTVTDLPNVRMVFPFAGKKGEASGMHLPLVDGTEVLLEFLEGDPDRPVIMGSLYNASVSTPVSAGNNSEHIIYTPQDNRICLVDGDKDTIIIEAQKRIEAFSKKELLEIDSTGNYIRGSATNLVAFHAGAAAGANESGKAGTGGTSLVLNGNGKAARVQASDSAFIQIVNTPKIDVTAEDTTIVLNSANSTIRLTPAKGKQMGDFDGKNDSIFLLAKPKTSVLIDGKNDKVHIQTAKKTNVLIDGNGEFIAFTTEGGPSGKIAKTGDFIELKTKAGPYCKIDGPGKLIDLTVDDSNFVKVNGKEGKVEMTAPKTAFEIFGLKFEKKGSSQSHTDGDTIATHVGSKIAASFAHIGNYNLAAKSDIDFSLGFKAGFSKILKLTNKKDSVYLLDYTAKARARKAAIKADIKAVKARHLAVNDQLEALWRLIRAGAISIN